MQGAGKDNPSPIGKLVLKGLGGLDGLKIGGCIYFLRGQSTGGYTIETYFIGLRGNGIDFRYS